MPPPDGLVLAPLGGETDLDAVADLEARCFTNPWTRDALARELARSDVARVFVARLPGEPVAAFCSCWFVADELHVNTIAVDPPHRRSGIASSLMRYVIAEAARHGARRATLEDRASTDPARKLYESLGFVVSAVRPRYYTQPDEDALILWKDGLPDLSNPESWTGQS
jgi:[ribosomal protein S18]-alanine N-acetyltransferase